MKRPEGKRQCQKGKDKVTGEIMRFEGNYVRGKILRPKGKWCSPGGNNKEEGGASGKMMRFEGKQRGLRANNKVRGETTRPMGKTKRPEGK